MYEYHYDYMPPPPPKYGKNIWLCYMDTDSFVYEIKTNNFCEDIITNDVDARFDTSAYNADCLIPIRINKKVIGLIEDELGSRIMTEFMALRLKLYM